MQSVLIRVLEPEIEGGFSHSEIPGSKPVRGSRAYRSVPRPSSPLSAKASTRTPLRHFGSLSFRSSIIRPITPPSSAAEMTRTLRIALRQGHDRKDQFAQTYPGGCASTSDIYETRMIGNWPKCAGLKADCRRSDRICFLFTMCCNPRHRHKPNPDGNCQSGRTKTSRCRLQSAIRTSLVEPDGIEPTTSMLAK